MYEFIVKYSLQVIKFCNLQIKTYEPKTMSFPQRREIRKKVITAIFLELFQIFLPKLITCDLH
jgi:hypothetical protein